MQRFTHLSFSPFCLQPAGLRPDGECDHVSQGRNCQISKSTAAQTGFEAFFEMALTRPDGSDGALHLPSNRCDFHSGTEHCPQFIVIRAGPGAAGWSRTSHFPFAFSPLFWQSGFLLQPVGASSREV